MSRVGIFGDPGNGAPLCGVSSVMKLNGRAVGLVGAGAAVAMGAYLLGSQSQFRLGEGQTVGSLPIILDRVQAIGELHTARQNAETVINLETHREAQGWASQTPLATLVQAGTSNTALVAVKGTVEAGIDLSRARASWKGTGSERTLLLEVPNASIYEPRVDGKIHMTKRGLFWRDDAISLKALDAAKLRFRESARAAGLTKEAEDNAKATLEAFVKPLHDGPVEVVFTVTSASADASLASISLE